MTHCFALTVPPSDVPLAARAALSADKRDVNTIRTPGDFPLQPAEEPLDPPELLLQAVSTRPGTALVSALVQAVDDACGWIQDRQMVGATTLQLRVETQGRAMIDLYAALLSAGLELSRASHQLLIERCSCAELQRASRSCIISLRLRISLAAEGSLLPGAAAPAGHA